MELQEVFYTMGIIYMAVMFVVMIALMVAVFVIKHKVQMIQHNIEEKLHTLINAYQTGEAIVEKAKATFGKRK